MSLAVALVVFVASAAALMGAGAMLATAGDELAEKTGLGGLFVGALIVGLATSLPEIATDVTAVVAGAPDLAVADLFGSSMANMAILAIIDLHHRGGVWPAVELGHARVAAVAIMLTSLAVLGTLVPPRITLGWVGPETVLIAVLYVAAMAWLRRSPLAGGSQSGALASLAVAADHETAGLAVPGGAVVERAKRRPSRYPTMVRFVIATVGILVSAPLVALSAKEIADASGVGQTLIGSSLMAVSTSLPELIVALAAVRIGAHDLAVGNLFGSNAVNMSLLVILDAVHTEGPILAAIDPAQTTAAVGAILMMALAVAAIVGGTETRIRRLEPDAVMVLVAYVGMLVAVALAT